MHLPGETHTGDVFRFCVGLLDGFSYGRTTSTPPIERVLFGPAVLRRGKGCVFVRAARGDPAAFVN